VAKAAEHVRWFAGLSAGERQKYEALATQHEREGSGNISQTPGRNFRADLRTNLLEQARPILARERLAAELSRIEQRIATP
jgi:hypothetical protein